MNIFVTDPDPVKSAQVLPDKHIVKMPLETCQMLAIVCSEKWGHGYGEIHKTNGEPYKTDKGAFRGHPCTIWANQCLENAWWLLTHGIALSLEYTNRYGKTHSCHRPLLEATHLLPSADFTFLIVFKHFQLLESLPSLVLRQAYEDNCPLPKVWMQCIFYTWLEYLYLNHT